MHLAFSISIVCSLSRPLLLRLSTVQTNCNAAVQPCKKRVLFFLTCLQFGIFSVRCSTVHSALWRSTQAGWNEHQLWCASVIVEGLTTMNGAMPRGSPWRPSMIKLQKEPSRDVPAQSLFFQCTGAFGSRPFGSLLDSCRPIIATGLERS